MTEGRRIMFKSNQIKFILSVKSQQVVSGHFTCMAEKRPDRYLKKKKRYRYPHPEQAICDSGNEKLPLKEEGGRNVSSSRFWGGQPTASLCRGTWKSTVVLQFESLGGGG